MLLIDLMAPCELQESIELLRRDLFDYAAKKGFADETTMDMRRRLDLYIKRYQVIKSQK